MHAVRTKRRTILWAALLAGGTILLGTDAFVFDWLPRQTGHFERMIGRRLERQGLAAYWSMDEPDLREQVRQTGSSSIGTRRVAGLRGHAREFVPAERGRIRTEFLLQKLGAEFTVSCWLRLPPQPADQRVFQLLRIQGGSLVATLPDAARTLSWPVGISNRFFHVALVVDGRRGQAGLFVNGASVDREDVGRTSGGHGFLVFGQDKWTPPANFALDEVSLWNRCLTPDEVARVARPYQSVSSSGVAVLRMGQTVARGANNAVHSLLLAADMFNPLLGQRNLADPALPHYGLVLANGDIRFLHRHHNVRVENGLTGFDPSDTRNIQVEVDGRLHDARLQALGARQCFARGFPKQAFVVERPGEPGVAAPVRLLFRPPEESPFLLQILAGELARRCALGVDAPEPCVVTINGGIDSLYLCERLSGEPGGDWINMPGGWERMLHRIPLSAREILDAFDECERRYRRALCSDRSSPFNGREMRHVIGRQRDELQRALLARPGPLGPGDDRQRAGEVARRLEAALLLNGNPAPECVLTALDLRTRVVPGAEVRFESLTPEVLDHTGRVTRRPEPRPAEVRATVRCGTQEVARVLRVEVAESPRALPLLVVDVRGAVSEAEPAPFTARLLSDGDPDQPGLRTGEIRLRGNTALGKTLKHYYNLKFDAPHGFSGLAHSRHLLLTSAYRDASLIREKLTYDLFRSFAGPGQPRYAPHVRLVELVVNRHYEGVYEMTDRVDADLLDFDPAAWDPLHPAVLYKPMDAISFFHPSDKDAYVQHIPDGEKTPCWGPYDELARLINQTAPAAFAAQAGRVVDLANFVDFDILLNLSANWEGRNDNFYVARRAGPEQPFFFIPWDYDMTYFRHHGIIRSELTDRLLRDLPEFPARSRARWSELRAGPLSEMELLRRIDRMADALVFAGPRDYRRWPPVADGTHAQAVAELRSWVQARLVYLDTHYGSLGTGAAPDTRGEAQPAESGPTYLNP